MKKVAHFDYPTFNVMSSSEEYQTEISQLWSKEGANRIFRNHEDFTTWLNAPNPGLSGKAPINYIKSDIRKIADLLGRILYGVLS